MKCNNEPLDNQRAYEMVFSQDYSLHIFTFQCNIHNVAGKQKFVQTYFDIIIQDFAIRNLHFPFKTWETCFPRRVGLRKLKSISTLLIG